MPEPRRNHVRLIDIAERLNLTKVSVSKALRDHPDMASVTRELVKRTAREMGYVPNHHARSLQTKASHVLGVVVPKIRHDFFAEALAGIQQVAAERNYEILLGVSEENPDAEQRHIETFLSMRVDGLIVSVAERDTAAVRSAYGRASDFGVPLVFFDRMHEDADARFGSVTMDDRAGARAAVTRAVERGSRRIAHLAGPSAVNIGRERRAGYMDALRIAGLPVRPDWIVEGGFDERSGYLGFETLWRSAERPDAIFCASFPVALGVLDAMRDIAPEARGELLIIFFGRRDAVRFLEGPYICVAQPALELGRAAAASVFAMIDEPGTAPPDIRLPLELVTDRDRSSPRYLDDAPASLTTASVSAAAE